MLPRVFEIIKAASAVTALIGTSPVRCYRHGSAPQGVAAPYVTWAVVSGTPENNLGDPPPIDSYLVQVDCWTENTGGGDVQVEALAEAVRNALEPRAAMVSVDADTRDVETQRYRITMTFNFWVHRT